MLDYRCVIFLLLSVRWLSQRIRRSFFLATRLDLRCIRLKCLIPTEIIIMIMKLFIDFLIDFIIFTATITATIILITLFRISLKMISSSLLSNSTFTSNNARSFLLLLLLCNNFDVLMFILIPRCIMNILTMFKPTLNHNIFSCNIDCL